MSKSHFAREQPRRTASEITPAVTGARSRRFPTSSNNITKTNISSNMKTSHSRKASSSQGYSTSPSSLSSSSSDSSQELLLLERLLLLEEKLKLAMDDLETTKSRLSDREVEVEVLKMQMQQEQDWCQTCEEKDAVISELQLQRRKKKDMTGAVIDFDLILNNINELNHLLSENEREVKQEAELLASFQKQPIVVLSLYSNGFQLDCQNRFRPYGEAASRAFLKDLRDGFFPAELQGEYPEGVCILAKDRRGDNGPVVHFAGRGRRLQEATLPPLMPRLESRMSISSAASRATPVLSPIKKKSGITIRPKNEKQRVLSSKMKSYTPFANTSNRKDSSPRRGASQLKVLGVGEEGFLLNLVEYDTVKTLKGIIRNYVATQFGSAAAASADYTFEVFSSFPRRKLQDDSMTLGDLGLVPNGVLHVVIAAAKD